MTTLAATTVLAAIPLATAAAAGPSQEATSSNWAGYVANSPSNADGFKSVSGSWVQPHADCSTTDGSSSFWVGLGGQSDEPTGLEQTGTAVDCSGGQASAYAWYELIPAAPVRLDMAISAGDRISATVTVNGNRVRIQLADKTTGRSFDRTLTTDNIDVSSAEWIAEAPSTCDDSGCQPVDLSDFGSVKFTGASAVAGGHRGSISDGNWQTVPMALASSSLGAQASGLSAGGSAFSVSVDDSSATTDPYGYGDGYGSGSGSGSADPYGYGDGGDPYGYGSDPYGYGSGDPYGYGDGGDPYGYGDGSDYGWDGGYSFG